MRPGRLRAVDRARLADVGAAALVLLVAAVLFTRFGTHGALSRDEAVYAYGGQQLVRGVPPYLSIFDAKTPGATFLAGAAAAVASAYGGDQLLAIRVAFLGCACLAAVAVSLLARRIWRSRVAGIAAGLVFSCFAGFARDALDGPDAKTPGVLLSVVTMWLLARRNWFSAGLTAALAFLVWQPYGFYAVLAVVLPALQTGRPGRRRAVARALLGVAVPLLACVLYFAVTGALRAFLVAALVFPVTGAERAALRLVGRVHLIGAVILRWYGLSGVLLSVGVATVLIAGAATVLPVRGRRPAWSAPLFAVVLVSLLLEVGYAAIDFQSYPDVFPFLPYGALGIGGLAVGLPAAVGRRAPQLRPAVRAAGLAALAVLVGFSAVWFRAARDELLLSQQGYTRAVVRLVPPGATMWALGDPAVLVLSSRTNPDRYIYLSSGVGRWKATHTAGGIQGWVAQILHSRAAVLPLQGWPLGGDRMRLTRALRARGYRMHAIVGRAALLSAAAAARQRAEARSPGRT